MDALYVSKVAGWDLLVWADLGSSFWGMVLIVASTNSLTLRIAAGLLCAALIVVLVIAKNVSSSNYSIFPSLNSVSHLLKVCW